MLLFTHLYNNEKSQENFPGGQKTGKLIWVNFLPTLRTRILGSRACFSSTPWTGGSPPFPSRRLITSHPPEIFFSEHDRNTTDDTIQVHHRKNKVFETVSKDIEARARKERDEPRKRVSPLPHTPTFDHLPFIFTFKVSSCFFNPHHDQFFYLLR